jgi:hypothetical protein
MPATRQKRTTYANSAHLLQLLTSTQAMFWRQVETTTIFIIWQKRYRRIFAKQSQDVIETTREIHKELKQWFKA